MNSCDVKLILNFDRLPFYNSIRICIVRIVYFNFITTTVLYFILRFKDKTPVKRHVYDWRGRNLRKKRTLYFSENQIRDHLPDLRVQRSITHINRTPMTEIIYGFRRSICWLKWYLTFKRNQIRDHLPHLYSAF